MSPDRFGEAVEPDGQEDPPSRPHDPGCNGKGWRTKAPDADPDHPRPCLRCKPHLAPAERRRAMGLGGKK